MTFNRIKARVLRGMDRIRKVQLGPQETKIGGKPCHAFNLTSNTTWAWEKNASGD
jgi:hypothetical protein